MNGKTVKTAIVVLLTLLVSACGVPKEEHQAVLKDLENTKMELAETRQKKKESEEKLEAKIAELEKRIAELEQTKADLENKLEEAKGTISMYESETGGLEEALEATKAELEELRKKRQATEERLARYRSIAQKLASMVEAGKLSVKIRDGKMVIELSNNILFDSGSTEIKDDGQEALKQLANVLQEIKKRDFLVAGHTDNVPISSSRFESNWELSTARAVEVVRFLQENGVNPDYLAAAGYGEHDPIASNETDEGKALNRRIEIIVMPNLEELPSIPKDVISDSES
jgi:chemotaxis protein MotB